jgi:MFS family permease
MPRASARVLIILTALNALAYFDRQILALFANDVKLSLGLTDLQLGLLQGFAFITSYIVLGIPFGLWSDKGSRRLVVWVGTSIWSVATFMCGVAGSYLQLFAARMGVGAGEAALTPVAYSMISASCPREKLGRALSIFHIGSLIGASAAFFLGSGLLLLADNVRSALPILSSRVDWQVAFMLIGAPGVLLAFAAFLLPRRAGEIGGDQRAEAGIAQDGNARAVSGFVRGNMGYIGCHYVGFGLVTLLAYGAQAWMASILIRTFHWSVGEAGLVLGAVILVTGILGNYGSGVINDRLWASGKGDSAFIYGMASTLVIAIACPIALFVDHSIAVVTGYAILALMTNQIGSAGAHLQHTTPTPLRGRISASFIVTIYIIGIIFGPASVGFVSDVVVGDEVELNRSLALVCLTIAPIAALIFGMGRKFARGAAQAAATRDADHSYG